MTISLSYKNLTTLQYRIIGGGIIGGMENFWKTNKKGVGLKKGWKSGWERKQKKHRLSKYIFIFQINTYIHM